MADKEYIAVVLDQNNRIQEAFSGDEEDRSLESVTKEAEVLIKSIEEDDEQDLLRVEIWEVSKKYRFDYPSSSKKVWQEV